MLNGNEILEEEKGEKEKIYITLGDFFEFAYSHSTVTVLMYHRRFQI